MRKSLHFTSVSLSCCVPPFLFFFFLHFNTWRQRLKASAQLYGTQVARPFYDFLSVPPCLSSQFLLLHSTVVSREFLLLFLIAKHVKSAKFSVTTTNHYQTQKEIRIWNVLPLSRSKWLGGGGGGTDDQRKLTRTPSKIESTYWEYGKLPLPDLKKILDLGPSWAYLLGYRSGLCSCLLTLVSTCSKWKLHQASTRPALWGGQQLPTWVSGGGAGDPVNWE